MKIKTKVLCLLSGFSLLFCVTGSAIGQIEKRETFERLPSSELLDFLNIATASQISNYEQIKTWQGTLKIKDQYHFYGDEAIDAYATDMRSQTVKNINRKRPLSKKDFFSTKREEIQKEKKNIPTSLFRETESTVPFAIDMLQDKIFTNFDIVQNKYIENDSRNILPVKPSYSSIKAIITPEKFLNFRPDSTYSAEFKNILVSDGIRGRAAFVEPPERSKGRYWCDIRDPRKYIGDDNPIWEEFSGIKKYLEENNKVPVVGQHPFIEIKRGVKEESNIYEVVLTFENPGSNNSLQKQILLDSNLAFNPISIKVFDLLEGNLDYSKIWTYQEVDGVFLPETLKCRKIRKHGEGKGRPFSECEILFQNLIINAEISEDVFSYKNLGLKNGDRLVDKINGLQYTFQDGELIPASNAHIARVIHEITLEEMHKDTMKGNANSAETIEVDSATEIDVQTYKIFVPRSDIALKQGRPYILDIPGNKLRYIGKNFDTKEVYNFLLEEGKCEILWDGSLVTVRKAKASTIPNERPLKYEPSDYIGRYELPEKVEFPYSLIITSAENNSYFLTIEKIRSDGIEISYKKLNAEEFKRLKSKKKIGKADDLEGVK